ncbi:TPA: hypothetical protein RGL32_005512 [Klebsiella pneumoniae]|nr:hypothetical protein [Klebsiella pneumoniae]
MEDKKTASGIQKKRNTLLYIGIFFIFRFFQTFQPEITPHIQIALFQSIPSRGMLFLLFWNIKTPQTLDI